MKGSSHLVDTSFVGEQCESKAISFLLRVVIPMLRECHGWDSIILPEVSANHLNLFVEFIYTGRYCTSNNMITCPISIPQDLG